jgi:hypothetical protein
MPMAPACNGSLEQSVSAGFSSIMAWLPVEPGGDDVMADAMQLRATAQRHKPTYSRATDPNNWPELPWPEWQDTLQTLHMWMQVIGKIRLALAIPLNHWWHVCSYLTCRGLTTSPMPYGNRWLQIDFDFLSHRLLLLTNDGRQETLALQPMSVADFYTQVMERLNKLDMPVAINTTPSEIPNPIPFEQNHQHAAYDAPYVTRFWKVLLQTERVFTEFRSRFTGKTSPVHFFWGGADLAITRFSGRVAPIHASVPNIPDAVVQTAYSHEVSSCGFWPGGTFLPEAVFYAYAYPSPPGFPEAAVRPTEAYYHQTLGEFVLPYAAVRQAREPDRYLLEFLQSTYEAAAHLGQWNRRELETAGMIV